MSTDPNSSTVRVTVAATWSRSVTSHLIAAARRPIPWISCAVASLNTSPCARAACASGPYRATSSPVSDSTWMSAMTTSAPARASVSASARPSPREPPVTSATRPERSISSPTRLRVSTRTRIGMEPPETRYTRSGDVSIAYQVVGEGPLDLVYVPGWISNVELMWEEPSHAHVLDRLARFSRLILFDKRGTGLSDPVQLDRLPSLEERMDDVRAVMDAAGSEHAAVFGFSEGGLMSVLFAATYPERVTALVLYGTFAKRVWSPDYPWAPTPEARKRELEDLERS